MARNVFSHSDEEEAAGDMLARYMEEDVNDFPAPAAGEIFEEERPVTPEESRPRLLPARERKQNSFILIYILADLDEVAAAMGNAQRLLKSRSSQPGIAGEGDQSNGASGARPWPRLQQHIVGYWNVLLWFFFGLLFLFLGFYDRMSSGYPAAPSLHLPIPRNSTWNLSPRGLAQDFVRDIHNRVSRIEHELFSLQAQQGLDHATVKILQSTLPEKIAVTKDKDGKVKLPADFWNALMSKLEADASNDGYLIKREDVQSVVRAEWDNFIKVNDARIEAHMNKSNVEGWQDEWKKLMHNNHILSSEQVTSLLSKQYDALSLEIEKISRDIETKHRLLAQNFERDASRVAKKVVQSVTGVYKHQLPRAQLDAFMQAQARHAAFDAFKQVNFFSPRGGAYINPHLTSPIALNPGSTWLREALQKVIGVIQPVPLPPLAALSPWADAGDCWCTEPRDGTVKQLGITLDSTIFPTSITIEHIPKAATLNPGATPRDIELWAKVVDPEAREQVRRASNQIYGPDTDDTHYKNRLTYDWVRISKFRYDIHSPYHVQTFDMVGDLARFKAATNEFAIRPVSNWGKDVGHTCLYRARLQGDLVTEADRHDWPYRIFVEDELVDGDPLA